ncbi:hypothetical protein V6N13_057292 [Hibiscus sabdariffa]
MREPRYPLPRVVLCIHDKVGTSAPHTHRERWCDKRRPPFHSDSLAKFTLGMFVLPRQHGIPCHRHMEETGRNDATALPPQDFR